MRHLVSFHVSHPLIVGAIKVVAANSGMSVSEWLRCAVERALRSAGRNPDLLPRDILDKLPGDWLTSDTDYYNPRA